MIFRNHMKKAVTFFSAVSLACAAVTPVATSVSAESFYPEVRSSSMLAPSDVSADEKIGESKISGRSGENIGLAFSVPDAGTYSISSGDVSVEEEGVRTVQDRFGSTEEAAAEADIAQTLKDDRDAVVEGIKVDPAAGNVQVDVLANEKEIFSFLHGEMGLNHAAAAGILGNIYYESGFNHAAIGDYGTSYGICQWHLGRYENLKKFCQSSGLDYTSCIGQLRYLQYELQNSYPTVYAHLQQVPDTEEGAYDAAAFWCMYFEVPANREQKAVERGNTTRTTYWPRYANAEADRPDGFVSEKVEVERDPEIDYVKWMQEFARDDSHGYSEILRCGEPDVDAFSYVYYALQENHYLEGENERLPFNVRDFSGYLTKHGFMAKSYGQIEDAELTEGDIIVTRDMKTIGVYDGSGKMYTAKASEEDPDGSVPGDGDGKEVAAVGLPEKEEVMVFHLMAKDDSLPDYVQWMVDYANTNVHGYLREGEDRIYSLDVDEYSFLYRALYHNDYIEKGQIFDAETEEKVLRKAGFEDVTGSVIDENTALCPGDIVMDHEIGTAVYIGHNTYVLADRRTTEADRRISGDQSGREVHKVTVFDQTWEKVFRLKQLRYDEEKETAGGQEQEDSGKAQEADMQDPAGVTSDAGAAAQKPETAAKNRADDAQAPKAGDGRDLTAGEDIPVDE